MSRPTALIRTTDLADPRLEGYRQMSDGVLMRTRGVFVAEGRLVVARVLRDARYRVQSVLVSPAAAVALAPALDTVPYHVPAFELPASGFEALTGHDIHRGCLALVERPTPTRVTEVAATATTLVVLEAISNPDNVGSIFRTALALGAGGAVLSPTCCDPLYRKAIRTSMGAVFQLPWACADRWPDAFGLLRSHGHLVAALTPEPTAIPLSRFIATTSGQRVAFLLGTEGDGLTADALDAADARVRIPMAPGVDSLNVGVAAAIALSRRLEMTGGSCD